MPAIALAQEEPDPPDAEVEESDAPPDLETDDDRRRAVRGTVVPEEKLDPEREALRRFEEEAFRDALRSRGITDNEAAVAPRKLSPEAPSKPEEARPDLPWLADLKVNEVDFPIRWDPRVIKYLEFYKNDPRGRSLMESWLKKQGRYKALILDALDRHKLPRDLLYVCMIESSYDPTTFSRVGAYGLWQFMPGGGKIYGLTQDYWVDERADPVKSTEAVMLYWRDLYDRFGNWHVVLASFNAGYGAMLKSFAKYNTNDFWGLLELEGGLPWESSVYVPKALAASIVGHNKDVFGFDHIVPVAPFEYDRVTLPKSTSLASVAKAAGTTVEAIADLNPELRRTRTPAGVKDYVIRVPKGSKKRVAEALEQSGEWNDIEDYVIRHGERFEDVAKTHGISTKKLRELNAVKDVTEVRGGTVLVVPRVAVADREKNAKEAENDLYKSEVTPGAADEPMLVPVPDKDFTIAGRKRVFYRVVAGDDLPSIATAFGVKLDDLAAWNGLDTATHITARMVVVVWVKPDFDAQARRIALLDESRLHVVTTGSVEHLELVEGRKGRVRKVLIAKKGDTLESIGKPYGMSKYDVARINRRGYTTPLEPGEELVVYQIVDKKKAKAAGVKDTTYKNKPKKKAKRDIDKVKRKKAERVKKKKTS